MNPHTADNPFHVLGLPVTASDEDVARQYNRLCKARPDEQSSYRRAWEELRSNPVTRQAHELLEMPDTDYRGREDDWRSFERGNRKNPVDLAALAAESFGGGPPGINVLAFVTAVLDSLLQVPDADITALAAHAARLADGATPPVGIADAVFG